MLKISQRWPKRAGIMNIPPAPKQFFFRIYAISSFWPSVRKIYGKTVENCESRRQLIIIQTILFHRNTNEPCRWKAMDFCPVDRWLCTYLYIHLGSPYCLNICCWTISIGKFQGSGGWGGAWARGLECLCDSQIRSLACAHFISVWVMLPLQKVKILWTQVLMKCPDLAFNSTWLGLFTPKWDYALTIPCRITEPRP